MINMKELNLFHVLKIIQKQEKKENIILNIKKKNIELNLKKRKILVIIILLKEKLI